MSGTQNDAVILAETQFFDIWSRCFLEVLGQVAGRTFSANPITPAEPDPSDLTLLASIDGALRGEFMLRLPRVSTQMLGQVLLGEALDPAAEFRAEFQEAVEELLRQVAGRAATELGSGRGEVRLQLAAAPAPPWPPAQQQGVQLACEDFGAASFTVALSAALLASLRPPVSASQPVSQTFDAFMNVQLAVSLRFGERRMLLRDILDLNTGAVVELDRKLDAPVELLLDGKVIARGEAVVVGGNYGLRVTEVLRPQANE